MKSLATKLVLIALLAAALAPAQYQIPTANKDDWEEINFEFNMAVLTDGFPSLLRLAELLNKNADLKVRLDGHTDYVGSEKYNEKLSQKRAEAVKTFLEKYGARSGQIEIVPKGKRQPKSDNKTKEGRWVNRRVEITVLDKSGKAVGAGGVGEAIRAAQQVQCPSPCQDYSQTLGDILKKLDKLDDIARALNALQSENAGLRKDLDSLKGAQKTTQAAVETLPKPPTQEQVAQTVKKSVDETFEKQRERRFAILGVNAGADQEGRMTFSGRARYFAPFHENLGFQAQGEYMYFKTQKEGQFDVALVDRFHKRGQAGVFSSFKQVSLFGMQSGAVLGQAGMTLDYIFSRGRVGFFGTKGFLSDRVVNRTALSRNIFEEKYLSIVDQAGGSTSMTLAGRTMLDANVGWLAVKGGGNKPGATIRVTQPLTNRVALTFEGGWNETFISKDTNGRFVVGLQFGSFMQPKEYLGMDKAVPIDIPRIRYEMLTRKVRTGNDAPIANAGPDQVGVAAGAVTLDGSASYDPDGDAITYQWDQVGGPAVSISGRNEAKATFTAAEGQRYSFRLTVKDTFGLISMAGVTVTARDVPKVSIQKFTASPATVKPNGASMLSWQIQNADEAEITPGVGKVNAQSGSVQVNPADSTTYRLTARNKAGEVTETVQITVERPVVRIVNFRAVPATIQGGQSSNLIWETENADKVTISGIGQVQPTGTASVSPKETTTYILTASNQFASVTSTVTVTLEIVPVAPPRILSFSVAPVEIAEGESATLAWNVEDATEITISGLGKVAEQGSTAVTPAATTTYSLTAKNAGGETKATVTVTVVPLAKIVSFTATPTTTAKPGDPVRLTWQTTGALDVSISGVGTVTPGGSLDVKPTVDTTYTLTARGPKNTVSSTVTVKVTPEKPVDPPVPPLPGKPPVIKLNVPDNYTTPVRAFILDATASTDPQGDALKYEWTQEGGFENGIVDLNLRFSPRTTILLPNKAGDYIVQVKVTNQRGLSSVKKVTITLPTSALGQ